MSYMKLLKLLYLADRRALLELGRPITYDRYVSMDQGPVLSQTYNLIVAEPLPDRPSYWRRFISEPLGYDVLLSADAGSSELSEVQERILDDVFAEFGSRSRWDLVGLTHGLPEWEDPHGSSIPIDLQDVLIGGGMSPDIATDVVEALAAEEALFSLIGS
jgi:uncharacterized phage-associated protein